MVNLVNFDVQGVNYVMSDEFEARICKVTLKIRFLSSKQRVSDYDHMTFIHKAIDQVTAYETSSTSDKDTLPVLAAIRWRKFGDIMNDFRFRLFQVWRAESLVGSVDIVDTELV